MRMTRKLVFVASSLRLRLGRGRRDSAAARSPTGCSSADWDVEILTTCARDHFTWANEYPAGVSEEDGLLVRRFPAVVSTPRAERAALERRVLNGEHLTIAEQQRWMNDDLRVPELFHYLLDHNADYGGLVFAPYMFWTAFACSQIAPSRTVLWPCLHDEPVRPARDLQACLHRRRRPLVPNRARARVRPSSCWRRPAPHRVVGCGVPVPEQYDPDGFRKKSDLPGRFVSTPVGARAPRTGRHCSKPSPPLSAATPIRSSRW